MFASLELCARIERAVATDIGRAAVAAGGFEMPVGRGTAVFAGADSPLTKVVGLDLDVAALETVERTFAERGAKPTIELPTLAEPGLVEALGEAGYRARGFEDVLARSTAGEATTLPEGVVLETVPDAGLEDWLDVLVEGFAHPDEEGPVAVESFAREAVRTAVRAMAASSTRVLARREGVPAGAASLSVVSGIAFLSGAATLPAHRRRGLQTAMLEHRLRWARDAEAELACITTAPGSKSKQNALRRGFTTLYTRVLFGRP
ncbi:MAG: GNAT family N-acetyltransferase [Nannocystaceae bacterium]|nr:GNAT family N-acetyltransferase [bacterium]